jgi:hypothetical protein
MAKMTDLAKALRLVEGEKHVIFFSTGIPNSMIYGYTPDTAGFRADFKTAGGAAGDHVLRRQNEAMFKEFSAAGCSFYAFDTREYAKDTSLFTYDEQTFAMGSRSMSTNIYPTSIFKDDKASGLNSLKRITDLTGGKYYSNINMYEKNLDQVQAMTGTYYVLGYAINERWDGRFHDVKVAVKRKGCEVRAQTGYFNPKPFGEYTDFEKQIHLFDLALNEKAFSRLPLNVPMTALAYAVEGATRLGALARVPREVAAKLTGTRLELVTIFFDSQGEIAGLARQEADPVSLRGHDMAFAASAALKPGDYSCRLVIRDMGSGLSAVASAKATIGAPAAAGLQLGTPLLLAAGAGVPWRETVGRRAGEKALLSDAYPYDCSLASPVLTELPRNAASVLAVIPCAVAGGGQPDLAVSARFVDAATGGELPVVAVLSGQTQKGPLQILTLEFITADIPPGTYYLHVYAEDRTSGALGHTFTRLVVPAR